MTRVNTHDLWNCLELNFYKLIFLPLKAFKLISRLVNMKPRCFGKKASVSRQIRMDNGISEDNNNNLILIVSRMERKEGIKLQSHHYLLSSIIVKIAVIIGLMLKWWETLLFLWWMLSKIYSNVQVQPHYNPIHILVSSLQETSCKLAQ